MIGQDGLGFHPDSRFCLNGLDKNGVDIYPRPITLKNQRERKHTYVDTDKYKRCPTNELYSDFGAFGTDPCAAVISDVFTTVKGQVSGGKFGMPILYYKADVTKIDHVVPPLPIGVNQMQNDIYDARDNYDLLAIRTAGVTDDHPLYAGIPSEGKSGWDIFYENTWNKKVTATSKPYNENTFILISAGWDGLYGTRDDVYNFAE
jgi:hypothetical protein